MGREGWRLHARDPAAFLIYHDRCLAPDRLAEIAANCAYGLSVFAMTGKKNETPRISVAIECFFNSVRARVRAVKNKR